MFPAGDVGGAVGAFAVADGEIDDLEVEFCRAKDEVEIAEGIEVAKVGAVGGDGFVIFSPENFRAAQGIFDRLTEHPGECHAEEFVADEVQRAHGFFFHGVDETHAVDEFASAGRDGFVKTRQIFWRDGQICVEDHENIAGGFLEAETNGVGFANARLSKEQARGPGVKRDFLFDGFVGLVARMSFHEDELGL